MTYAPRRVHVPYFGLFVALAYCALCLLGVARDLVPVCGAKTIRAVRGTTASPAFFSFLDARTPPNRIEQSFPSFSHLYGCNRPAKNNQIQVQVQVQVQRKHIRYGTLLCPLDPQSELRNWQVQYSSKRTKYGTYSTYKYIITRTRTHTHTHKVGGPTCPSRILYTVHTTAQKALYGV